MTEWARLTNFIFMLILLFGSFTTSNPLEREDKMQLAPALWADLHCSFCGKGRKQVKCLIADPNGGCICDECVGVSDQLLEEKKFRIPRLSNADLNFLAKLKAKYPSVAVAICDLTQLPIDMALLALFSGDICRKYGLFPAVKMVDVDNVCVVVTTNPDTRVLFEAEVQRLTGCRLVETFITSAAQIEAAIEMYYPKKEASPAEPA
jgi:hypothetical protein